MAKNMLVPIDHLVHLKETRKNLKLLKEVKYKEYGWILSGDF
jgi:hypothetical protein